MDLSALGRYSIPAPETELRRSFRMGGSTFPSHSCPSAALTVILCMLSRSVSASTSAAASGGDLPGPSQIGFLHRRPQVLPGVPPPPHLSRQELPGGPLFIDVRLDGLGGGHAGVDLPDDGADGVGVGDHAVVRDVAGEGEGGAALLGGSFGGGRFVVDPADQLGGGEGSGT
eukprot:CAMPEP_0113323216 /NCGR_PEP_ID=MMETSP0010_2-20120614/16140_1 /TAXON_ID=216773 ORGANISM="Corethron hystrix, Strain 308" /NCGR_SAMPLE_ID=MMETSP0010_2 /ASSEMBLY_ACC=CAM_ASM_000155 /LENGTH=171 /DNA_ID=CAMNT_0000182007 /DNA_START=18 /DNA_END=529 /DNA_ORIENTATION=+ /assembly_acc=CAM_ASM_000155